ncbi:hypothetical protein Q1695_014646 [Nippostrongylus brasiliensis]|nr:hypothetical protein Q1695_014646 [Nippostrongylus brasiliensis]
MLTKLDVGSSPWGARFQIDAIYRSPLFIQSFPSAIRAGSSFNEAPNRLDRKSILREESPTAGSDQGTVLVVSMAM